MSTAMSKYRREEIAMNRKFSEKGINGIAPD
jgi:hypothetical protein